MQNLIIKNKTNGACAPNASTVKDPQKGADLCAVLAFFSVVASSQIFPLVKSYMEIGCKGNKNI